MRTTDETITDLLTQEYHEALEIVSQNTKGAIWLIGGSVYRRLASKYHGTPLPDSDYDFLVEQLNEKLTLQKGWDKKENRYKNPKLTNGKILIDIVPLHTVHSIVRRNLNPTLENYLSGTPFDVQSIAYDTNSQKIIDHTAVNAIKTRTIRINNHEEAIYAAKSKGTTVIELMVQKAKTMKFIPVFI